MKDMVDTIHKNGSVFCFFLSHTPSVPLVCHAK